VRIHQDPPLPLIAYFLEKIPEKDLFKTPTVDYFEIWEDYSANKVLTSLVGSLQDNVNNAEILKKYKDTVFYIIELVNKSLPLLADHDQNHLRKLLNTLQTNPWFVELTHSASEKERKLFANFSRLFIAPTMPLALIEANREENKIEGPSNVF